jgi:hypothetical protein
VDINKLYDAIMGAEHQGFLGKEGYSPWIRTKHAPEGGSSAYGPVQLTGGKGSMLANVARGGADIGASPEEMEWIESKFLPQAQKFLHYGKEPLKEGYHTRYEYGGAGDFTDKDKGLYESVAKKLIASELKRAGGEKNIDKFISSWRGKSYEDDPEYYDFIKEQVMMDNVLSEQGSEAF